jgi:MFS family permease
VITLSAERQLIGAMCAALMLNMVGFANMAVVLPAVSNDFGLNAAEAGILGGAFFAAYAVGVPLFVPLTDRVAPLTIYLLGSLFWIAGGLCVTFANSGVTLPLLGRTLSGFGMAATYMPGLLMLITRLPAQQRSSATSTYSSCITLGTGFCFAVSGLTALYFPWRAAFAAASVAAAIAVPIVVFAIWKTPLQKDISDQQHSESHEHPLRFLLRGRMLGLLAAVAGNSWEGMAFRTWWIAYLVFASATNPDGSTLAKLAIITALAGLAAMPISVIVARKAQGTRRVPVLVGVCIASGIFALVPPLFAHMPLSLLVVVTTLYLCFVFADAGTLPAAVLDETPPLRRGVAMAAAATIGNIAAFTGTATVGAMLNLAGGPSSQWAWVIAFATMGAGSAIGGATLWLSERLHLSRTSRPH